MNTNLTSKILSKAPIWLQHRLIITQWISNHKQNAEIASYLTFRCLREILPLALQIEKWIPYCVCHEDLFQMSKNDIFSNKCGLLSISWERPPWFVLAGGYIYSLPRCFCWVEKKCLQTSIFNLTKVSKCSICRMTL